MGVGVGVGVGVDVGVDVGVSSMNLGDDGFGCCTTDGLKPVRVGLVCGEAVTRRGFDTARSDSLFVNGPITDLPCSCVDKPLDASRVAFLFAGLGSFSLFVFDEESFVPASEMEHDAQILFAGSIIA